MFLEYLLKQGPAENNQRYHRAELPEYFFNASIVWSSHCLYHIALLVCPSPCLNENSMMVRYHILLIFFFCPQLLGPCLVCNNHLLYVCIWILKKTDISPEYIPGSRIEWSSGKIWKSKCVQRSYVILEKWSGKKV